MASAIILAVQLFALVLTADALSLTLEDRAGIVSSFNSMAEFAKGSQGKEIANKFVFFGSNVGALESDIIQLAKLFKLIRSLTLQEIRPLPSENIAEAVLLSCKLTNFHKKGDRWYLIDASKDKHPKAYDSDAKSALNLVQVLQEAYFARHKRYSDSFESLLAEKSEKIMLPLLSKDLLFSIKEADQKGYLVECYHKKGTVIFTGSNKGGPIQERSMKPLFRKKDLSGDDKEKIYAAFENYLSFLKGKRDKDTVSKFVFFGERQMPTDAELENLRQMQSAMGESSETICEFGSIVAEDIAVVFVGSLNTQLVKKIEGHWYFLDLSKELQSDIAIDNYNSQVKSALSDASTAQEVYYASNRVYADSIEKIRAQKEYKFSIPDGVTLSVEEGNKERYRMNGYHVRGKNGFTISGPGGVPRGIDK